GGAAVCVDTRKTDVMKAALAAGARMINDVSALTHDDRSAGVLAAAGVSVVLMHHQGAPETMQDDPRYDDVLVEVYLWLEERIRAAEEAGIARNKILVDPGFGFGKMLAHNLELMNGLAVKRRASDPEAAGDLGHAAAIMADGEANDIGLDLLEQPQMAVAGEQGDLRRAGDHLLAPRFAERRREIGAAAGIARLYGYVREMLGGERLSVA